MIFNILPHEGTDIIKLNTNREEIRNKFISSFIRDIKRDNISYDQFTNFRVSYDGNDRSDTIEFYEPTKVAFNDFQLMNEDYIKVENFFKKLDSSLIIEKNVGLRSLKYQIGIYAPYGKVEAILVGKQGYYE